MLSVLLLFASLPGQAAVSELPSVEGLPGHGQEEFEPFAFVQVGDPQIGFGGAYPAVRRFERLAQEIESSSAEFGIVVGDLVHDRSGREYGLLRRGLEAFRLPLVFVPGNHDVVDLETLEIYRSDFGRDYYSFVFKGCGFIGVNSELFDGAVEGGISESETRAQWDWLEAELESLRDRSLRHLFLFLHRPPETGTPTESDLLNRRLREYGVRNVLAGHWHTTEEVEAEDGTFTLFTVGGTSRVYDDRGYGYRIFDVTDGGVEQRYIEFDRPSDHWLVRYGWSPRILDPSLPHWLLTLACLAAAGLCLRAHRRGNAEPGAERTWVWLLLCVGYLFLALDRQLDFDEILQAVGRRAASSLQAYGGRRVFQVGVLAIGGLAGLVGLWAARRQIGEAAGRPVLGMVGFGIPAIVFLLHALSLHQVDALLYAFGRGTLYSVEAVGIGLSCWAARR